MKNEKAKTVQRISDFPTDNHNPIAVLFRYKNQRDRYLVLIERDTVDVIDDLTRDKKLIGEWLHAAEWIGRHIFNLPLSANVDTTTHSFFGYSTHEQFYRFYVADCAFPPFAIVDGDGFYDAMQTFECEFERWMKIEEPDLSDYDPENLYYNDNGTPIDSEAVHGDELELVQACYSIDFLNRGSK